MMISQWFDPQNIEHIKAYDHLQRSGVWPEGFLPEDITIDSHWQYMILSSIAEAYMDNMIAKHHAN